MPDMEKVKKGIFEMLQRDTWKDIDPERIRFQPVLNDVLVLLKGQEEQIRKLTEEIEELRKKRNEVYYSGYDGSFIL